MDKKFTLDDLKDAFRAGGNIKSWSDYGYVPVWDDFDQWYKNYIK